MADLALSDVAFLLRSWAAAHNARRVLRAVEWDGSEYIGVDHCPLCHATRIRPEDTHAAGCELAQTLAELDRLLDRIVEFRGGK